MHNLPLVSIIIPSHNKGSFLLEAVLSALAQTWEETEVIVVDDCSTDNSRTLLQEIQDRRLHFHFVNFKNASAARNFGLEKASGEFIQFLDADDVIDANKLKIQLADMEYRDDVVGVCNTKSFYIDINETGKEVDTAFLDHSADPLLFLLNMYRNVDAGMVQPNAWLTPAVIIKQAGKWNEKISVDDDGEFFCRVLLHSKSIAHTSLVLNYYRKFENPLGNLSAQKTAAGFKSMLDAAVLKKMHLKEKAGEDTDIRTAINGLFAVIMVSAYPKYLSISSEASRYLDRSVPVIIPGIGGSAIEAMKKIFGWKAALRLKSLIKS